MAENIRDEVISVGTTVVKVSEDMYNSERNVIILTNTSTGGQIISLAWGKEAVAGSGIVLSPGGFHQESKDAGFKPSNKNITAISSGASGTLAVHERMLVNSYDRSVLK